MGNETSISKKLSPGFKVLYEKLGEEDKKIVQDFYKTYEFVSKNDIIKENVEYMGVLLKILSNPLLKKKIGKKLKEACNVFSTPEVLRSVYLNLDWTESLKKYDEKFKEEKEENLNRKSLSFVSKVLTSDISSGRIEKLKDEIEELSDQDLTKTFPHLETVFQHVKIKLVISEISKNDVSKSFRKMASPILSKLDLLPDFGMFHSSIMIGPYMIDWNDSGVSIPRKCVSQAALISTDIGEISTEKKLDDMLETISKFICHWNCHKIYKESLPKSKDEGNCQDFVNELLNTLGIKYEFTGALGQFVKKLREEGKCKISFEMDTIFRDKFGIKEKMIEFKTHKELDVFVKKLMSHKTENFKENYKGHYELLKSFDRAFWLRFFKYPGEKKYHPQEEQDDTDVECLCPFGNPLDTGSMIEDKAVSGNK